MEPIYTAIATATGGGRDGHVSTEDGQLDLDTRPPKETGGSGEGTNPEQLFAAGYSACFLSAIHSVGRHLGVDTSEGAVSASVTLGKIEPIGYNIAVDLDVYLPNTSAERRQEVIDLAHRTCPYSNATRGNVEVTLAIVE